MTSTVDVAALLRRLKPERRTRRLVTRPPGDLVAAADLAGRGRAALLLDTNVYIRSAAGTLPPAAAALVDRGLLFHSSVAIAELTTGIAMSDPARPGSAATRRHYAALIATMPPARILVPDAEDWAEAGLIAGLLARLQGFQPHQRKDCLADALILLTGARYGLPVLTANRDDFDLIQQIAPRTRFVHF